MNSMSVASLASGVAWSGLSALGSALLQSTWQISVLGLAFWAIDRSRLLPRIKHDLGLAMLCLALVWPASGLVALGTQTSSPPESMTWIDTETTPASALTPKASQTAEVGPTDRTRQGVFTALALLWITGSLWMLLRLALGVVALGRLRRLPSEAGRASEVRDRVSDLGRWVGMDPGELKDLAIRVPRAAGRFGICTFGILRPALVVPLSTITGLSPTHLDALLLHELAHLQRRDAAWAALQSTLDCLLFFHPVARWISARVRHQRELACDDLVLDTGVEPGTYARALLSLARNDSMTLAHTGSNPTPAQAASGGNMTLRIRRVLEPRQSDATSYPAAIVCFALVLLVPVALAALSARAETSIEESAEPVEVVLRGEVMTFSPAALKVLRSASFGTSAAEISGALLDRDRERHFRPHVQEVHSSPMLKVHEGDPGAISTAIIDPNGRDRFRAEDGRVTNGTVQLVLTPRTVTSSSALLDVELVIEPGESVRETAVSSDSIRLLLKDVVVTRDKPLLLHENTGTDGGPPLHGLLLELVMTSKERSKLEQPVSFAVKDADYNEVLNTILRYVELDRDDAAVDLDRFDIPITLQAQQIPAGEMLEIVLRMNCLQAELDPTTARITEIPGCEPSRGYTRLDQR